jgi:hypothetical protein
MRHLIYFFLFVAIPCLADDLDLIDQGIDSLKHEQWIRDSLYVMRKERSPDATAVPAKRHAPSKRCVVVNNRCVDSIQNCIDSLSTGLFKDRLFRKMKDGAVPDQIKFLHSLLAARSKDTAQVYECATTLQQINLLEYNKLQLITQSLEGDDRMAANLQRVKRKKMLVLLSSFVSSVAIDSSVAAFRPVGKLR